LSCAPAYYGAPQLYKPCQASAKSGSHERRKKIRGAVSHQSHKQVYEDIKSLACILAV